MLFLRIEQRREVCVTSGYRFTLPEGKAMSKKNQVLTSASLSHIIHLWTLYIHPNSDFCCIGPEAGWTRLHPLHLINALARWAEI